jgi:hypothetical protein
MGSIVEFKRQPGTGKFDEIGYVRLDPDNMIGSIEWGVLVESRTLREGETIESIRNSYRGKLLEETVTDPEIKGSDPVRTLNIITITKDPSLTKLVYLSLAVNHEQAPAKQLSCNDPGTNFYRGMMPHGIKRGDKHDLWKKYLKLKEKGKPVK